MRAIVVAAFGEPDVLRVAGAEPPVVPPGHVLVRVAAAGVNFTDTRQRRGLEPGIPLPFTPGIEGAGTVAEVGEGVTDVRVGDRVGWQGVLGGYAELALVPAAAAVPLPDHVTEEQAAAVMLQGLSSHQLAGLAAHTPDGAGTAVVHAAAGGVGLLLTQILQLRGYDVIGTVSTEAKAAAARRAGAREVLLSGDPDLVERVRDLTGGTGAGIVYDGVGADLFTRSLDALAAGGVLAHFGQAAGPAPDLNPFDLPRSILLTKPVVTDHVATRDRLLAHAGELFGWLGAGRLDLTVERFQLAEAAEAHRRLEGRRSTGKLVLVP
ncbi:MAG: quinone oxidoreductase family protein [Mycobacteriales bacterium]